MMVRQDRQTRRPLGRAAGPCGARSNVLRDSAVLYGAGMMLNDMYDARREVDSQVQ